jgi:AraC-like DNA-binding protein
MGQLSTLFAPLAISQLALLGLILAYRFKGMLARLLALFCLCLIAYLMLNLPLFASDFPTLFVLGRLATLSPYVLWLIAYLLFVDEGHIKPLVWITIGFCFLARTAGQLAAAFSPEVTENLAHFIVTQFIPQIAMLGFSIHTMVLGYHGYSDDLVVHRRRFRVLFILCMGAVVTAVLAVGTVSGILLFLDPESVSILANFPAEIFTFYIFAISLFLNFRAFRLSEEAMSLIPRERAQSLRSDNNQVVTKLVDPATTRKLEELMTQEKLYTQTGLTISDLAERLDMQEYKLRRLINQSMGYRNFNQFLNNYRIQDASRQLQQTAAPVSSIALGVGYSSLSVFNKAFKDRFDMTPTEFRNAQPAAESGSSATAESSNN